MKQSIAQQVNLRASAATIPLNTVIELTYHCNQQCSYCFQRNYDRSMELETAQWTAILGQLAKAGTFYITLTGGEPFVRSDLLTIIEYARAVNFAVSIITNGTMVTGDTAKELKSLGVVDVGVSLLGSNASTHDSQTGVQGSFNKACRAIDLLLGMGIKVVLKHTVTKENFGEYPALRRYADTAGCLFECDTMVFPSCPEGVSPFALNEKQIMAFYSDMDFKSGKSCADNSWALHCDAGRSVCGICPDGTVVPCVMLPVKLGNISEVSFAEIWAGAIVEAFRREEQLLSSECTKCAYGSFCSRCHAIAMRESGSPWGPAKTICRHTRVISQLQNPGEEN